MSDSAASTIAGAKAVQMGPKSNKRANPTYPPPLIIPAPAFHTHTLILLHGRGSTGSDFGPPFLQSLTTPTRTATTAAEAVAGGKTLQSHLPGLQVIFPTAKPRRARWHNRAVIRQWFDSVPIEKQDVAGQRMTRDQAEWQLEGLRETTHFLRPVLDAEVRAVGARNVFLGGLSQGCAMALHLLLGYQGASGETAGGYGDEQTASRQALGGFVGLSGWLPFVEDMEELIGSEVQKERLRGNGEDDDDPFANSDDESAADNPFATSSSEDSVVSGCAKYPPLSPAARVCNLVRDTIDQPSIVTPEPLCLHIPVFLGHGRHDSKVRRERGLRAARLLRDVGMRVTWREYDEGHWYKVPEEIDDVIEFLRMRMEAVCGV
ncbi:MAG: hypothetical protein M1818_001273 [Claussenomyces sp. TS43310]|nr:MAG: hypothetical protein M1818_001273 [Claussenomyces sp. TS43310]